MKILFTFFLAFISRGLIAQEVESCPFYCKKINLLDYDSGMVFYFPDTNVIKLTSTTFPQLFQNTDCNGKDVEGRILTYLDLAGKKFVIDSIKKDILKAYGPSYRSVQIWLRDLSCKATYVYNINVDTSVFLKPGIIPSDYTIEGAIYLPEVMEASKRLVGQYYFTSNEVKAYPNKRVRITSVKEGDWQAPLSVTFVGDDNVSRTILAGVCNTNVPQPVENQFLFKKYFRCSSEMVSEISLGMSTEMVKTIKGQPQESNTKMSQSGTVTEYTYKSKGQTMILSFTNNELRQVETKNTGE